MLYLLLIMFVLIWTTQRQKTFPKSSAAQSGGWHGPGQTAQLGGSNIDGNTWDNGTTQPILNSQWSGYDSGIGNIVFAVQGGEDGQNPAQPLVAVGTSQVTTLSRFQLLGGGDPTKPPSVPVQVSTINDKVRRIG
jgi:hypothetical protein